MMDASKHRAASLNGARKSGYSQYHRRITPEALEAIELALLRDKGVHHDVAEIDQDPATSVIALDADRSAARLDRFLAHRVGDRLHLTFPSAGADDEQVGDRRELRNVQHEDVLGLLVARCIDHDVGHGSGREVGHRYRRFSPMYRSADPGAREPPGPSPAAPPRRSPALGAPCGGSHF